MSFDNDMSVALLNQPSCEPLTCYHGRPRLETPLRSDRPKSLCPGQLRLPEPPIVQVDADDPRLTRPPVPLSRHPGVSERQGEVVLAGPDVPVLLRPRLFVLIEHLGVGRHVPGERLDDWAAGAAG